VLGRRVLLQPRRQVKPHGYGGKQMAIGLPGRPGG
jgi:hypothetical protein|tara:strand:- start:1087 stop:1191 length:105 start_codon:yes stop_codon:yes gene_type:complete